MLQNNQMVFVFSVASLLCFVSFFFFFFLTEACDSPDATSPPEVAGGGPHHTCPKPAAGPTQEAGQAPRAESGLKQQLRQGTDPEKKMSGEGRCSKKTKAQRCRSRHVG